MEWPDDPETVEQARAQPGVFAGKTVGQVADHVSEVIAALNQAVVVGHSFGGLLAQIAAGGTKPRRRGDRSGALPRRTAVAHGPRSAMPVLANPANRNVRSASPCPSSATAGPTPCPRTRPVACTRRSTSLLRGARYFQAAFANLNPRTEVKVDTRNPQRGPLLLVSGGADHTVPRAITKASLNKQKRNPSPTEFTEVPNRGHALTIDSGWREVADRALEFVKRF